jgi:hypothetical protein
LLADPQADLVPHPAQYRVDGEIGRFRFDTFDVRKAKGPIVFSGASLFPTLKGREWYETSGFKKVALMMGVTESSYRRTNDLLNYSRRQLQGGTPLNTLRDTAESEGTAILEFLETESARILKEHHFAEDGTRLPEATVDPAKAPPATLDGRKVRAARRAVQEKMRQRGMPENQVQAVAPMASKKAESQQQDAAPQKAAVYEDPQATVNISMDDVSVKKQKEEREPPAKQRAPSDEMPDGEPKPTSTEERNKRPAAYTTVARIDCAGRGFTLVGASVWIVLRFVLAFLLVNSMAGLRLLFFIDGQRSLQDSILVFFRWHPCVSIVLDWFHLIKKCKEGLSLALKGRTIRNQHLKEIARLLWYGLVSEAITYVGAIPAKDIKDRAALERLIGYFERNRPWIPCYAMRRWLGLQNSSNPAERTCNLVTSHRQKNNGMSWSPRGSLALAAITAVALNGHTRQWLKRRAIPLVMAQAA